MLVGRHDAKARGEVRLHGRIAHAQSEFIDTSFRISATRKTLTAIAAPVKFRLGRRRCSSMVEHLPSKQDTRVRFPSPAPYGERSVTVTLLFWEQA